MFRLIVSIGQLLVMASLAEYCSIWPTAGGQQFYAQVRRDASLQDGCKLLTDAGCGTRKHAKISFLRGGVVRARRGDFHKYELCFE